MLCCCGDTETESRDREAESDSVKPSTRTPQRAQRRETSVGVRECLNFGLNRLEPAISAVSADTSRVGTNQPDSAQIGPSLSRVGASRRKKKETTWQTRPDARSAASLARRRVAPRRTRVRHLWSRIRASQYITLSMCVMSLYIWGS